VCSHRPSCPAAESADHAAARAVSQHHDQGWTLLCNGVVVFEDMGELLPGGASVPPQQLPGGGRVSSSAAA
jgi:hypothetical protein